MKLFKMIVLLLLSSTLVITAGCTRQLPMPVQHDARITETSVPNHAENKSYERAKVENTALSTQWGETIRSTTEEVEAVRVSTAPFDTAAIYYQGGKAPRDYQAFKQLSLLPIQLNILDEYRHFIPIYRDQNGKYMLYGTENARYSIYLTNNSYKKTYEVIITVDGLDVVNGTAGSYQNRGYLLRPGDKLQIDGFRKNAQQVAAFRFGTPESGYVNYNAQGDKNNIGVIGVALFEVQETTNKPIRNCSNTPNPFPKDGNYAPEPCIP